MPVYPAEAGITRHPRPCTRRATFTALLRRIGAVREDTGETLVFLTNHHGLGGQHDCGNLQGPLANRVVLQGTQAEHEDQDICRHIGQCGEDPDLDSTGRHNLEN